MYGNSYIKKELLIANVAVEQEMKNQIIILKQYRLKRFGPYIVLVLVKDLIVLAERRQEYDGGDVLKTVDPLPPL